MTQRFNVKSVGEYGFLVRSDLVTAKEVETQLNEMYNLLKEEFDNRLEERLTEFRYELLSDTDN